MKHLFLALRIVSCTKGLLASSSLRGSVRLCDAVELDHFQCRATVTGWIVSVDTVGEGDVSNRVGILDRDITVLAHVTCCNPLTTSVESRDLYCAFCHRSIQQDMEAIRIFRLPLDIGSLNFDENDLENSNGTLEWFLDDGTGVIIRVCGCVEDILGLSATSFLSLTHDKRIVALDEVVGAEFWYEVSKMSENRYRAQAAVPATSGMGDVVRLIECL